MCNISNKSDCRGCKYSSDPFLYDGVCMHPDYPEILRNSEDIEHIEARANQERILQTNSERTPRKHPQSREKAARNEQFFGTFSAKKDHFRKWWSELYQNPEPLPCRWILVHSFSDGEALYCAVNCTKPLDQSAGTVLQLTEKRKHPPAQLPTFSESG